MVGLSVKLKVVNIEHAHNFQVAHTCTFYTKIREQYPRVLHTREIVCKDAMRPRLNTISPLANP